ncbi:MAG: ATP-binding protein [Phycisphaerae bacterium]|nr:ATP-binding protein [Phycisphaerae bacterium]
MPDKYVTVSTIASDLRQARQLEDSLIHEVGRFGYSEAAVFAIKLALEEAINNAIRHGNRCDPDKRVTVRVELDTAEMSISVTDEGPGFNPGTVPDPTADENLEKPSGRGIMLMRAYMDDVHYNQRGNEICMCKRNA